LELFLALLLADGTLADARERGVPPSEGIVNFGKVNARLYRGAQPDATGIETLARFGIKTIIDLRTTNEVWNAAAAEAVANGLTHPNVPMQGYGRQSPGKSRRTWRSLKACRPQSSPTKSAPLEARESTMPSHLSRQPADHLARLNTEQGLSGKLTQPPKRMASSQPNRPPTASNGQPRIRARAPGTAPKESAGCADWQMHAQKMAISLADPFHGRITC
jgi:hypothetical protein